MTTSQFSRYMVREAKAAADDYFAGHPLAKAEAEASEAQYTAELAEKAAQCCTACGGMMMDDYGRPCKACDGTGGW